MTAPFQWWQNWPHEQLKRSPVGFGPGRRGFSPALPWTGVFSAAITCVWIHQDFSVSRVTLLPHARLFPGLSLGWGIWLGRCPLRIWNEREGKAQGKVTEGSSSRALADTSLPEPPPQIAVALHSTRFHNAQLCYWVFNFNDFYESVHPPRIISKSFLAFTLGINAKHFAQVV